MELKDILCRADHTLLKQYVRTSDITELCDDALTYHAASVCIPPCYVRTAKDYCKDDMRICTVIGFPNGYSTARVKALEACDAIENGADEIDAVINICDVKNGDFRKVLAEIKELRKATDKRILKIIIETCFLTQEEKLRLCDIVTQAQADFIKTSTGFGTGGATIEDVALMKKNVGENVRVKASGGIRTLDDAARFIQAGADRLGTSAIIKLVKEKEQALR